MGSNHCRHSSWFTHDCCRRIAAVLTALLAILVPAIVSVPAIASATTLQSVYDGSGPNGQYNKYLVLDGSVTYTGGLLVSSGVHACIRGNGAILDLQESMIQIHGIGAKLDIDHCVIINGCLPSSGYTQGALDFVGSAGRIMNNTIDANMIGIKIYLTGQDSVVVINNIIVHNTVAGLLFLAGSEPQVSYNDAWGNGANYLVDLSCDGMQPWSPLPGTGEMSADPRFVNEAQHDFHLLPNSPCLNAGYPSGAYIGAAANPTAVMPTTWGRIKATFRAF